MHLCRRRRTRPKPALPLAPQAAGAGRADGSVGWASLRAIDARGGSAFAHHETAQIAAELAARLGDANVVAGARGGSRFAAVLEQRDALGGGVRVPRLAGGQEIAIEQGRQTSHIAAGIEGIDDAEAGARQLAAIDAAKAQGDGLAFVHQPNGDRDGLALGLRRRLDPPAVDADRQRRKSALDADDGRERRQRDLDAGRTAVRQLQKSDVHGVSTRSVGVAGRGASRRRTRSRACDRICRRCRWSKRWHRCRTETHCHAAAHPRAARSAPTHSAYCVGPPGLARHSSTWQPQSCACAGAVTPADTARPRANGFPASERHANAPAIVIDFMPQTRTRQTQ